MEIWKLGCTWGKNKPDFYNCIRENLIVICDDTTRYKIGDLVALARGETIVAIAKVLTDPESVTLRTKLKEPFEDFQIDYIDWVKVADVKWLDLGANEQLSYETRVGRCRIQKPLIRTAITDAWKKYNNEIPIAAQVIYAYLVQSKSHRAIEREVLKKEAKANGGGFLVMTILHDHDMPREKKGILRTQTIVTESIGASEKYKSGLQLLEEYYPELNIETEKRMNGKDMIDISLNTILYGPPGTGKTYQLVQYQNSYFVDNDLVSPQNDLVLKEKLSKYHFWQILAAVLGNTPYPMTIDDIAEHPFIQARVNSLNGQIANKLVWEALQAHADDESMQFLPRYRGKYALFHKDKELKWSLSDDKKNDLVYILDPELLDIAQLPVQEENVSIPAKSRFSFITFHQKYSYEDFIEGIKPLLASDNGNEQGSELQFELKKGVFFQSCLAALKLAGYASFEACHNQTRQQRAARFKEISQNPQKIFGLFIDEINRANISAVFGELITLLEDDKRMGQEQEIWAELPYSNTKFCVPPNLYIIGTMNTADRSIALLDIALRRRFEFKSLYPFYDNSQWWGPLLETINQSIYQIKKNPDFFIGHAFFMGRPESDKAKIFNTKIIPLLAEYFQNNLSFIKKVMNECNIPLKETGILENYLVIADEAL